MNKFHIFIFILTLNFQLSTFNSFAQADPPLRIELECEKDQQDYKFVALGNHGAAVFYQSAVLSLDTAQWVFIQYDTNFVRTNFYKIKIPNLCQYLAADFSNNKLYLFLQKPAFKKDTLKNYLLEWDILTQGFQLFHLQNFTYPYFASIKVADDHVFITLNDQKRKSIVYYNYKNHTNKAIEFPDDEVTSIESFCLDTLKKQTYFCMFLKNKKNTRAELFITDYSGNIKENVVFPYYNDLIYNSARIAIAGKDSLMILGGYTNIQDKKPKTCYSGIYALKFTKNRFSDINTYTFGALLKKDSAINMKFLQEPNLTMNGYISQSNGHTFLITDVFFPEYQYFTSSSYRGYGYYGYDIPTERFEGFRFLYAYILEFNPQGMLVNEWYFPIKNVLTKSLYNLVKVHQDEEVNNLFYYVNNNEVVSQLMHGQSVLAAQSAILVELLNKTDRLDYSSNISMQHWYNNSFLLSGYQYIKNPQRGQGRRYVFFLNKLICE